MNYVGLKVLVGGSSTTTVKIAAIAKKYGTGRSGFASAGLIIRTCPVRRSATSTEPLVKQFAHSLTGGTGW
jgi:hypothetical protein